MSDRLGERFAALRAAGRGGLVTYVMAGDPDPATSAALLARLPQAGADIIELGMAFSDPMADGPAIQAAGQRALAAGMTLARTLAMVRDFRNGDGDTPVVLMGYYNPVHAYGAERFVADARAAGVDGLIIVDLPPEEDAELRLPARAAGLHFVRLATPTTGAARLPAVLGHASGFIYHVSIAGITGTRSADAGAVGAAVARLKAATDLPIAVGFGIRTPEQAAQVARLADAAVVGSALVETVQAHLDGGDGGALADAVAGQVRDLAAGVRGAREEAEA